MTKGTRGNDNMVSIKKISFPSLFREEPREGMGREAKSRPMASLYRFTAWFETKFDRSGKTGKKKPEGDKAGKNEIERKRSMSAMVTKRWAFFVS